MNWVGRYLLSHYSADLRVLEVSGYEQQLQIADLPAAVHLPAVSGSHFLSVHDFLQIVQAPADDLVIDLHLREREREQFICKIKLY